MVAAISEMEELGINRVFRVEEVRGDEFRTV